MVADDSQSLLDVSDLSTIEKVTEIELSASEDSVQSLGNLATKDGLITLAGINSSSQDLQADKNDHLRSFFVTFPSKAKGKDSKEKKKKNAEIVFGGKTSMFQPSTATKKETYQRLLRLSPVKNTDEPTKRIGVIATGFASESEVIVFDATTSLPDKGSIIAHFKLEKGDEANELDILEIADGRFALVYCTDHEVYLYKFTYDFASKKISDAYKEPFAIRSLTPLEPEDRPRFRSVRFLGSGHVLVLQNLPGGAGSDLVVLLLAPDNYLAFATLRKRFPTTALDLAVCPLDADPSGHRQILIAVAMQDISIQVFTLDHRPAPPGADAKLSKLDPQMSKFNNYTVLKDVHPLQISKVTFAAFRPPRQSPTSPKSVATAPAYVKLASVSVGNTVVVDTFTLTSVPCPPALTAKASAEETKGPKVRWVLSTGGTEYLRSYAGYFTIGFVVLVFAFLLQSYLSAGSALPADTPSIRDNLPPGAVPPALRSAHASAASAASYVASEAVPSVSVAALEAADAAARKMPSLRSLLDLRAKGSKHEVVVSEEHDGPNGVRVRMADDGHAKLAGEGARRYEELSREEQQWWLRRLTEGGHWAAGEGEKVLKSVMFAQVAEYVGGGLRDAVLNH